MRSIRLALVSLLGVATFIGAAVPVRADQREAIQAYRARHIADLLANREALLGARREQAQALLEEFVATEPADCDEMPDALLRLAELRWQVARAEYLTAFGSWQDQSPEERGLAPELDLSPSIALLERILNEHAAFPRRAFVRYMLAYAHLERDDPEEAMAQYRAILTDHPQSRFVADAHFALAEAALGGDLFEEALSGYAEVLRHEGSALYDFALFKSAWCLWRLGRGEEAAVRFREVLDLADGGQRDSGGDYGSGAVLSERRAGLQDEALGFLIQVFVEDERNSASDVFEFLDRIGGEQYGERVLTRLSDTYFDQGRNQRAVEAYGLLEEMDPSAASVPRSLRRVAAAKDRLLDREGALETWRRLLAEFGADSTWASQQASREAVSASLAASEQALRTRSLQLHQEAQEDERPELFVAAEASYALYLEFFPEREESYDLRFFRAEILYHRLERFAEAGNQYLAAARAQPEGEHTRDALLNSMSAHERVREAELAACEGRAAAAEPADGDGSSQNECGAETENDRAFGEAIELYVSLFPEDPELPEILYRQGRLYFDRRVYDPAVRLFGQLLERFPTSEYAVQAGELILQAFSEAEDYANIEQWARRLKDSQAFQDSERQGRLDQLIVYSIFEVGAQRAEEGAHAEAAAAYLRAAEEFPEDDRARRAYYNAGLERQRAGDLGGAAEAYDALIERFPGSEEGALGAWQGAQMYESIALFGDAAGYYERYATRFPDAERARDAHYNAVLLRLTAGDHADAIRLGQSFLERFQPRGRRAQPDDQVDTVVFFVARAHEAREDWDEAATTYRDYARRSRNVDRKIEAYTRLGQVLLRDEDAAAADAAFEDATRTARRQRRRVGGAGSYYAAQARYLQGEQVLRRYDRIEIAGPEEGLRDRLQEKADLLAAASNIFADVVSFGAAEWIAAALFQIGHAYEGFADAMRRYELPAGLSEEEEDVYLEQLAGFIVPMEERALQAFEGGYARAIELQIYNRWTAALREGLTRLNDVAHPPLRETGVTVADEVPLPEPEILEGLRRVDTESEGS